MSETSYASLIPRPAMKPAAAPRNARPRATAASTVTSSAATGGLARVEQVTPPQFLGSLNVVTNAAGDATAIVDYQDTEPGSYTATARWDAGPAESIVLDQPGEFWHDPTTGSLYPPRHGLTSGQPTLEVTVTNAGRGVSATTSTAFTVEFVDPAPGSSTARFPTTTCCSTGA